ncbi:MAG TPA: S8/S53 family peptidase [Gammaproteobacteria bacterium]|jgi:hypothetical protein
MTLCRLLPLLVVLLAPIPVPGAAADDQITHTLLEFVAASCRGWEASGAPAPTWGDGAFSNSDILFRGRRVGTRFRSQTGDDMRVELEVIAPGGRPTRFIGLLFNAFGDPLLLAALDRECELQVMRRIDYAANGQALKIETLDADLQPLGEPDWLNPPLPPAAPPPGDTHAAPPLRVGMIDSGVDYQLDEIFGRLARAADGEIVGYDFWEMDAQPYDAHPVDSGFFLQRHGTRTASVLLREAPMIELVPYRYPRPDMSRMRGLIEHAAEHDVGIVGMPLGSNHAEDWGEFARAARDNPQILFVASAGNNGRDIDEYPVYPASLELDNLVVVTSADDFLRPAVRTNWGRRSVDFMLPAENLPAIDYGGQPARVSGSSYAVSRLTALAARIKAAQPGLTPGELIDEMRRQWAIDSPATRRWVAGGYIADPLAGEPIARRPLPAPLLAGIDGDDRLRMPLEVLVLDERWSLPRVAGMMRSAYDILAQCGIGSGDLSVYAVDAPDYLRDLSTGSARTLLEAAGGDVLTVVLARDTRMLAAFTGEAFGIANTAMRPWLTNSVWLMLDVDDPGIALAHEIYHVLANNGDHVEGTANLMQARTRPDSTELTPQQCQLARTNGVSNALLQR